MLSSYSMTGAFNVAWEGVCLCIPFASKETQTHSKCTAPDGWCDIGSTAQPTRVNAYVESLSPGSPHSHCFVNRETTASVNPPPLLSS